MKLRTKIKIAIGIIALLSAMYFNPHFQFINISTEFSMCKTIGLIAVALFVISLFIRKVRAYLANTIFNNTIYGNMLRKINNDGLGDSKFNFNLLALTILISLILFYIVALIVYIINMTSFFGILLLLIVLFFLRKIIIK